MEKSQIEMLNEICEILNYDNRTQDDHGNWCGLVGRAWVLAEGGIQMDCRYCHNVNDWINHECLIIKPQKNGIEYFSRDECGRVWESKIKKIKIVSAIALIYEVVIKQKTRDFRAIGGHVLENGVDNKY